jgi:hypothetical protein
VCHVLHFLTYANVFTCSLHFLPPEAHINRLTFVCDRHMSKLGWA